MSELKIQSELVKATIKEGGFAFKMNNRFKVGVVDLYIKLPDYPAALIEVKYAPHLLKRGIFPSDKCRLTPHQKRFIHQVQEAGGHAGWCVVAKLGQPGFYGIIVGNNPGKPDTGLIWNPEDKRDTQAQSLTREHGGAWPIWQIVARTLMPPSPRGVASMATSRITRGSHKT